MVAVYGYQPPEKDGTALPLINKIICYDAPKTLHIFGKSS